MTDWIHFPNAAAPAAPVADDSMRSVRLWLWSVAALVFLMVLVGGATRLTESGLSITEWKPVTGVLPPLNEAAWLIEFEKYKQIPQYRELFPDMDLARFKVIFFWEWSHRLLGRLIGFAFALPLAYFWLRGRLSGALKLKLSGILALGALQGFVGWWMVASGLTKRVEVAQERLAIHLLLACLTLTALVWLARALKPRQGEAAPDALKRLASIFVWLVLVQIGLGALVAGLRAGLTFNTWPLMDGKFLPALSELFAMNPAWSNLVDNVLTVQFNHRMAAYLVALWALIVAFAARGEAAMGRSWVLAATVLAQVALGIVTLLWSVPIHAALAHQGLAMVVLWMAVVSRQKMA